MICFFVWNPLVMRALTLLLLSFSIAGCANGPFSAKRDLEASGQQQGQLIACSGYKMWPDCYQAAKQACPNGFDVLAKEESLPTQTRTLRISCK
jgi:hypothetical protein